MSKTASPAGRKPARSSMDRPLPVYSDFSHMSAHHGIGDVKFVVGLREEDPDAIISRVFPLTKIIPVERKARPQKKKPPKEDKPCTRPDCAQQQDLLLATRQKNKMLWRSIKSMESTIGTVRNKISLSEKSILMTEERNESLLEEIENSRLKLQSLLADADKATGLNISLRSQLQLLLQDIETQRRQQEAPTGDPRHDHPTESAEKKMVFSRALWHRDPLLATEVSMLHFSGDDDSGRESD